MLRFAACSALLLTALPADANRRATGATSLRPAVAQTAPGCTYRLGWSADVDVATVEAGERTVEGRTVCVWLVRAATDLTLSLELDNRGEFRDDQLRVFGADGKTLHQSSAMDAQEATLTALPRTFIVELQLDDPEDFSGLYGLIDAVRAGS